MSLSEYAEYIRSPQIANTPQTSRTTPTSFSIAWTSTPNMMGTRPPNPQFQPQQSQPYIKPQIRLPNPNEHGTYPVGLIQSRREPYAVQEIYTQYGDLESGFGTNLGRS